MLEKTLTPTDTHIQKIVGALSSIGVIVPQGQDALRASDAFLSLYGTLGDLVPESVDSAHIPEEVVECIFFLASAAFFLKEGARGSGEVGLVDPKSIAWETYPYAPQ